MLFRPLAAAALVGAAAAQDLTSVLMNATGLSNLTTYLGLFPEFTQTLASLEDITLLAPNNEAFAKLLNSSAGASLVQNDTSLIQAFFSYHVLNGTYSNFTNVSFIPTALQPPQYANVTGGQVVGAYHQDDSTSFISGLLANSSITGTALNFTGGVIHIIESALVIPQNISETAVQLNLSAAVGALTNASLAAAVDHMSDVTVFVPNNAAFRAIGSALPNLTMEELTSILQYHVVEGVVGYSTLLENGTSLMTAQGTNVTITKDDTDVFVNEAKVVIADVLVSNGVVHVIDNVLNPNNATTAADPSKESGSPAFSGASSASDVPYTSVVPTPTSTVATEEAPGATAASSSSSEGGASMPMKTGAFGAAALFGGAALVLNM